jgi:S1-C subfamily serine protease
MGACTRPVRSFLPGVIAATIALGLVAACAGEPARAPQPDAITFQSPLSGTIGVAVAAKGTDVVVVAVRADSAAARAHLQPGDRILRLDGVAVTDATDFERRVLDAVPRSVVKIDFARGTETRSVELPVEEVLLAVRA